MPVSVILDMIERSLSRSERVEGFQDDSSRTSTYEAFPHSLVGKVIRDLLLGLAASSGLNQGGTLPYFETEQHSTYGRAKGYANARGGGSRENLSFAGFDIVSALIDTLSKIVKLTLVLVDDRK